MEELKEMLCKELLRALSLSSLEKRRLRADLLTLCRFLRRGNEEAAADLFFLKSIYRT